MLYKQGQFNLTLATDKASLADFADEDENQLFALEWLEMARQTPHKPDGSIPRQRLSVDVADGGGNFSVITHSIMYASFTYYNKQTQYSFPAGRAPVLLRKECMRLFDVSKRFRWWWFPR